MEKKILISLCEELQGVSHTLNEALDLTGPGRVLATNQHLTPEEQIRILRHALQPFATIYVSDDLDPTVEMFEEAHEAFEATRPIIPVETV